MQRCVAVAVQEHVHLRQARHLPELVEKLGEEGMINIEGIVNSYAFLYNQSPQSWTFELDLRTSIEKR